MPTSLNYPILLTQSSTVDSHIQDMLKRKAGAVSAYTGAGGGGPIIHDSFTLMRPLKVDPKDLPSQPTNRKYRLLAGLEVRETAWQEESRRMDEFINMWVNSFKMQEGDTLRELGFVPLRSTHGI